MIIHIFWGWDAMYLRQLQLVLFALAGFLVNDEAISTTYDILHLSAIPVDLLKEGKWRSP
jgi:hypothetical protein